jgi:hypothetical protein
MPRSIVEKAKNTPPSAGIAVLAYLLYKVKWQMADISMKIIITKKTFKNQMK